jgi:hypothetical protein
MLSLQEELLMAIGELRCKVVVKKNRGRPKKEGKRVDVEVEEDIVEEVEVEEVEVEEDIVEDVVVKVRRFEYKGKMYLRTNENVVYDVETEDEIGVFNEERGEIEYSELEEEEEVE